METLTHAAATATPTIGIHGAPASVIVATVAMMIAAMYASARYFTPAIQAMGTWAAVAARAFARLVVRSGRGMGRMIGALG